MARNRRNTRGYGNPRRFASKGIRFLFFTVLVLSLIHILACYFFVFVLFLWSVFIFFIKFLKSLAFIYFYQYNIYNL